MTLKEQLAAKKAAKAKHKTQQAEKHRIESIKRERDWKRKNDVISPIEFGVSTYKIYLDKIKLHLKNNDLTIDDILQSFIQLHRFCFLETEYDFTNIRTIIESLFDKHCSEIGDEATTEQLTKKINIHYKQRELLHQFCTVIYSYIASFKSRTVFAESNLDMITGHQAYCALIKPVIARFISKEDVAEAQKIIRQRAHGKELYTQSIAGKLIITGPTGDYIFL